MDRIQDRALPRGTALTGTGHSITIESMSTYWSSELVARTRVHAALGEPARLAIVDRLLLVTPHQVK